MTHGCGHDDLLTTIAVDDESVRVCSRPECVAQTVALLYETSDAICVISAAPVPPPPR